MSSASITFVLFGTALSVAVIPGLALVHRGLSSAPSGGRGASVLWAMTIGVASLVWLALGAAVVAGDPSSSDFIGAPGLAGLDTALLPVGGRLPDLADPFLLGAVRTGVLVVAVTGVIAVVSAARTTGTRAVVSSAVWAVLVLLPVSMWVYAVRWDGDGFVGGWLGAGLRSLLGVGALDFGGGALHIALGASLLALTSVGSNRPRDVRSGGPSLPGSVALVGSAFLLWVGSVGSAGAAEGFADEVASLAVMNALCAPAAAGIAWMVVEHIRDGRSSTAGGVRGVVAGVAVVSAGSGFLTPMLALLLGLVVGILGAITIRGGRDGRLSERGTALLHLVGGATGIVALGFAAQGQGILYSGSIALLCAQVILCIVVGAYAYLMTGLIARLAGVARSGKSPDASESVQEAALT